MTAASSRGAPPLPSAFLLLAALVVGAADGATSGEYSAYYDEEASVEVSSAGEILTEDLAPPPAPPVDGVCHPQSQDACNKEELEVAALVSRLVEEGKAAASKGSWDEALATFERATALDGTSPFAAPAYVNMALVKRRLGLDDQALVLLRRGAELDPRLFYAHYNLGNLYSDRKSWADGDRSFASALELALSSGEANLQAATRTNWANLLYRANHHLHRTDLSMTGFEGRDLLKEAHEHLKTVHKAADEHGSAPMRESVTTLSSILNLRGRHKERKKLHKWAVKKGLWKDPWQRPERFDTDFARTFDARPWLNVEDIVQSAPWMAAAREKWRDLRIEADQLLGSGALRPVGERVRHDRELYNAAQGEWKEHAIINAGQEVQYYSGATGKIDPVARSLAREAPGVILGNPAAQVVYSVLLPGSKVLPHCGPSNEVVTCHLALKVPKTAVGNNKTLGMSVGGETRQWREGEWLCFEDSFEHKVWNFGKSPRVVLLVSMLHPRRWGANGAGASQDDGSRSPAEA